MTVQPTPENENSASVDENIQSKKHLKHKKLIIVLSVILAFIVTLASTFFIIVKVGEARLKKNLVSGESLEAAEDGFDENAVYHNGKPYYYNDSLINILFIGVDKNIDSKHSQGQADALYLFSLDKKKDRVNVVSISRNTLCKVDVLSAEGDIYGNEQKQICLAYSYGNNNEKSSENCVRAVSRLLYNIPINGYYTLHLNSISDIIDAVGGVTVKIPEAFEGSAFSDRLGQTITLKGNETLNYLQVRGDSNAPRVERHKAFIKSFAASAKAAVKKDVSLPFDIIKQLGNDAVTNIDVTSAVYLGTDALNWKMDFANVEGEYSIENGLEVLRVNEQALKNTVMDVFYTTER